MTVTGRTRDETETADRLRAQLDAMRAERDEALRQAQASAAREALLRSERQHQVRNMIAVIRSIFARTVSAGGALDEVADHFKGRLDVIARYQLSHSLELDEAPSLEAMVCDELQTYMAGNDVRVTLDGPGICIAHDVAQLLGLALHELMTNAIKFGALSTGDPRPRLAICWTLDDQALQLHWRETGVTILSPVPVRIGFGREYLEEALPYQLGGSTAISMRAGELNCTLTIPRGEDRIRPDRR